MVLSSRNPLAVEWYMLIVQGLVFFVIYYVVFRFAIKAFNLKTLGRTEEAEETTAAQPAASQSREERAVKFIDALGGACLLYTSYPKEIEKIEERLKSRFGWGLTTAIEPPDLETRVAILLKKAEEHNMELPEEVAFFIAQRLRTNVRELEGALNRVKAMQDFKGGHIDIDFVRDTLKDILALQERLVTIENIQNCLLYTSQP